MGISGNLKTMVLAELLQWLSQGQKTGTLVIDNGEVEKRIFFDQGMIISSASTDPKEYLGHFLVSHGYLSDEQVNEAVKRQKAEKQLLGKILVTMGAISEADLHQMLMLKAEESIYDIFTWEHGDFRFLDRELPAETMVRMELDVQWIVLEGSRRLDEWNRLREYFPSPLTIPVSIVDLSQLDDVEEVDLRLLTYVDDRSTVEEISHATHTSLFQVCQVLLEQVRVGRIKTVVPRTIEVEVRVEVPVEVPVEVRVEVPVPMQAPAPQPAPVYAQPPPQPIYAQPPQMAYAQAPAPMPSQTTVGGQTLHFAAPSGAAPAYAPAPAPAPAAPPPAATQPAASEAGRLRQEAEDYLRQGNFEKAALSFRQAREAPGLSADVKRSLDQGEERLSQAFDRDGVKLSSVPKLKCSFDELTKLNISPQEGFLLTRVDGSYSLQSILKMTPMPKLDAQLLFWKLKKSGHITI